MKDYRANNRSKDAANLGGGHRKIVFTVKTEQIFIALIFFVAT